MDRLATYKENDKVGIFTSGIGNQTDQTPGKSQAGSLSYEAADSAYGNPHLAHPVMYIQVPDNAIWDQTKPLEIKTGLVGSWGSNSEHFIPRKISTLEVNGHTFLKVDLSNYADIKRGFSVKVYYNNGIDFLTSTKHSPFLVVADNLDKGVDHVNHPTANSLTAEDKDTFEVLIDQENIDVQKASYDDGTSFGPAPGV